MKLFILLFLCGLLCSVDLQMLNYQEKHLLEQKTNSKAPVIKEPIWFDGAYENFRDKFYKYLQNRVNADPCVRIKVQDISYDQPAIIQQENAPNRRSYPEEYVQKDTLQNDPTLLQSYTIEKEDIQPKQVNSLNLKNEYQQPSLPRDKYLFGNEDLSEDLMADTDFTVTRYEKNQEQDEIYDLDDDSKPLQNLLPTTNEPLILPTNVKCADGKREDNIKDGRRRNGMSDTNVQSFQKPETNDDVEQDDYNDVPILKGDALQSNNSSDDELFRSTKNIGRSGSAHGLDNIHITRSKVMLMDYDRICYACSTVDNPTCIKPNRQTTIKYCRKGVDACSTRTYRMGGKVTLVRDCGQFCNGTATPGFGRKFEDCTYCHTDLCNSAHSIKFHSIILTLPMFTLIFLFKRLTE